MAHDDSDGPVMLCLTSVLKPPPARIGKIPKVVQFERTWPLKESLASVGGALIGLIIGATFLSGLQPILFSALICGGIALSIVYFEPGGEPLWRAIALYAQGQSTRSKVKDGDSTLRVGYAIGIAPIPNVWVGRGQKLKLRKQAVHVLPGTYDERGVLIHESNKNLEAPVKVSSKVDVLGPRKAVTGNLWSDEPAPSVPWEEDSSPTRLSPREVLAQRGRTNAYHQENPSSSSKESTSKSAGAQAFMEARRRAQRGED